MYRLVGLGVALCAGLGLDACALAPKPTSQNPASVTMNFAGSFYDSARDREMNKSALTYWRKVNDDGSFGDRFAIGGANAFNRAINTARFRKVRDEVVLLDSGEYFLDSFELEAPKSIAQSQAGDYTKRDGWDHGANAPRFLSIRVDAGAQVVLPKFVFKVIQNGDKSSYTQEIKLLLCPLESQQNQAKSAQDIVENVGDSINMDMLNRDMMEGFAIRFGNAIPTEIAPRELCQEIFGTGS